MTARTCRPFAARALTLVAVLSLVVPSGCGLGEAPSPRGEEAPLVSASGTGVPCEVDRIVDHACRICHTAPPVSGAPFPLRTHGDFHRQVEGSPVFVRALDAVREQRMPLEPGALDEVEQRALLEWLESGAPYAPGTCD